MCGLNGVLAYALGAPVIEQDELERTRDHMRSRGPDGAGLWIDAHRRIGLAHRRLAIQDPRPDGAQPMTSACGRYRIVFNGEIYNFAALRGELERAGQGFRTRSDTEVLLELYRRDGTRMFGCLRGMFALAIWDDRERTLVLARDLFGIKPLYVHDDGRSLRFASQVRALIAGGALRVEPEPAGHVGFRIWGHVPEPWTLHRGIVALEPGTWMSVAIEGRPRTGRFGSVAELWGAGDSVRDSAGRSAHEAAHEAAGLREALLDSVRHHLVSDVPVGVFLSAGIDSGVIAALAAEVGGTLRTVTLGFEEYRGTPDDETVLAEAVARANGASHHTAWVTRAEFESALASIVAAMDQPSTDGLNTWLVSRAAAEQGLKVALSGLGGDEFFGGYPSFRQVPRIRAVARPLRRLPALARASRRVAAPLMPSGGRSRLAGLFEYGGTWEGAYLLRRALRMPWQLDEGRAIASDPDFVAAGLAALNGGSLPALELPMRLGAHAVVSTLEASRYMRDRLLRDADWAGMAHSLEIRVPLVDAGLLGHLSRCAVAGAVPGKRALAAAARPALPDAVVNRPKTGFTVPLSDWLLSDSPHRQSGSQRGDVARSWQDAVGEWFGVQ